MLKNFSYLMVIANLIYCTPSFASQSLIEDDLESYKKAYAQKHGDQALANLEKSIFMYVERSIKVNPDVVNKEIIHRYTAAFAGLTIPQNLTVPGVSNMNMGCFQ